ncbi:hypothetical protein Ahy_B09g098390 isoform C [Arachis hypogaea]|uniref:Uncharacterized protein n=1 Tax=Arachis hypogaea TaxID=3818 RepID=A0A444XR81_ARAHY|nr:hypothetical protein Ahy_B09g098390 isoform C [Arachis hypogaea]
MHRGKRGRRDVEGRRSRCIHGCSRHREDLKEEQEQQRRMRGRSRGDVLLGEDEQQERGWRVAALMPEASGGRKQRKLPAREKMLKKGWRRN